MLSMLLQVSVPTVLEPAFQTPTTPKKIGVLYHSQGESQVELPRVTGKKRTARLITARSPIRMEFQGNTSAIKIEGSNPTFVILFPSGDITKLSLYPLNVNKNSREAVVGTGGSIHGESLAGAQTLPIDIVKESADSYRIASAAPLKAGEYAFAFAGSNEFFCFTAG